MGLSDEEFYELYGRLPRRKKKKYKIYWGRIIVALILLIGLIIGFVKLVGFVVNRIKGDDDAESKPDKTVSEAAEKDNIETTEETAEVAFAYSDVQLIVCIDPGHGDYDAGASSRDGMRNEKDDCLKLSLKVKDYLEGCGVKVIMTRSDDTFVDLEDRCTIANNANADMFISIHRNSYEGDISGVEAWVNNGQPTADTALARNILNKLNEVGVSDNRGVQYGYVGNPGAGTYGDNYYINNDTVMPSVLLEVGFITNDVDNQLLDQHWDDYAKAISIATIETGIELGVVDKDGTRLLSEPLRSPEKYVNQAHDEAMSVGGAESDGYGVIDQGDIDDYIIEETEPSVTPVADGYSCDYEY